MYYETKFFTLALLFFAFGCAKQENIINPETTDLDTIEARINQARVDIEADYRIAMVDTDEEDGNRSITYIDAESQDALADAIANAGHNQKIILRAGNHYESSTIVVDKTVWIIGEPGAVLYFDNEMGSFDNPPVQLETGFFIKDVSNVRIEGIEMHPVGGNGSMVIFMDNAPRTRIIRNTIANFRYPIWASNHSDRVSVYDNVITGGGSGWGVSIESGKYAKIRGNQTNSFSAGIFASDKYGIIYNNETNNGSIGILLCTVQGTVILPNEVLLEPAVPCDSWLCFNNNAANNLWNFLIIDGAHDNLVFNNTGTEAILYDIDMAGESQRFGFTTPTSYNNIVWQPIQSNTTIKVCGENNIAYGGQQVDTAIDPCW